jgi:hypothetical protein
MKALTEVEFHKAGGYLLAAGTLRDIEAELATAQGIRKLVLECARGSRCSFSSDTLKRLHSIKTEPARVAFIAQRQTVLRERAEKEERDRLAAAHAQTAQWMKGQYAKAAAEKAAVEARAARQKQVEDAQLLIAANIGKPAKKPKRKAYSLPCQKTFATLWCAERRDLGRSPYARNFLDENKDAMNKIGVHTKDDATHMRDAARKNGLIPLLKSRGNAKRRKSDGKGRQ